MSELLIAKPVAVASAVLYLVGFALLLPLGVVADDFDRGNRAYVAAEFAEAYRLWLPLAEAGDPRAQFGMGSLYDYGQGVEVNYFLSANWFQRSARQGLAIAQFNLGNAFHHGRGVPQDDGEAVRLWRLAAQQGLPSAQYNLGTQYLSGLGVKQDQVEARRWYQRAANSGHPGAIRSLAWMDNSAAGTAASTPGDSLSPETPAKVQSPTSNSQVVVADTSSLLSGAQVQTADWLLEQNPEHLTLQLAVMSEEERVLLFVGKHEVSGLLSYFPIQRGGRTLFILTSGIFEDRPAALQSLENLPESVQNARPWIRRLGAIQEQIRASNPG